jgi:hypothetical protein
MGIIGAVGMSMFRPLMQRIFERDLKVLASLTGRTAAAPA